MVLRAEVGDTSPLASPKQLMAFPGGAKLRLVRAWRGPSRVSPPRSMMIVMWFSRYREFRTDEGGATLAGCGK
jgi:hypothetical protein